MTFLRTEKHVSRIGLWGRSMGAVTWCCPAPFHPFPSFVYPLIGAVVALYKRLHDLLHQLR